ncbi:MAG: helix-turn-helix domain-containing protein [Rhodobacteraceae bacterium]|nr:helix-turn-helix domain-containing protein [Paracoccaceae bacterium]
MPAQKEDQFLDTANAAHYLGYSASTLEWWRTLSPRRGPRYYKMAGRVRYRQSDLDAWMENGLVETRG